MRHRTRYAFCALAVATLPASAVAAPRADWTKLAQCAAAYQANAHIADPERPASMTAMISEVGDDYRKAAIERRRQQKGGSAASSAKAVRTYVAEKSAEFGQQPRAAVERFIDACPQPDE
jgi:hypothetical protein